MEKELVEFIRNIFEIDSPSGYCHEVISFVEKEVNQLGYQTKKTKKGNLEIYVEGKSNEKTIGLCAHVDTLGLMVRSIKNDGTLAFTNIGGPIIPTLDGEYCRIMTRNQKIYTGTILSTSPSAHVYNDSKSKERNLDTMCIRIDEKVKNKEDVQALGIQNGDYIAYDPKTTITESGFIKSRFLDDKISVAIIYEVLRRLKKPQYDLIITISTYEEVGHGCSYISKEIDELVAVDMGCIGDDLSCSEYDVSICAKDSSGPYDYNMTTKLIKLAKENRLQYAVDIYPYYGSDASAALKGGQNIRAALIGPGVHASHGMERTHKEAIENTIQLIMLYICKN
jgi:Cellulase M and related proteins